MTATRGQRERLLRAATDAFAAQGFRGASLDAVAEAVGITRQGLLHYFPSKIHLLVGVLELRHEDDMKLVMSLVDREDGFTDALLALARHNAQRPGIVRLFTVLAAESVDAEHPAHEWFRDRYRRVRADLVLGIQEEQRAGRLSDAIAPASLAALLVAVMDGLQLQHLLDP